MTADFRNTYLLKSEGPLRQSNGKEDVVARFLRIQHRLNPLHVYCRFLDRGHGRRLAVWLCKSYEVLVFVWVSLIIKLIIHWYCLYDRNCRIRREIGKAVKEGGYKDDR